MRVRYILEKMTMADVPRVIEIERLAYPSTWPASAYKKELQENRWAHYIVLRDRALLEEQKQQQQQQEQEKQRRRPFPLSLLPSRPTSVASAAEQNSILGFAGLWLMVDEAHVTTIAMHPDYRRKGLGELMLSKLIDIAYEIGAHWVTLEVRVSNHGAQSLYRKYGFKETGLRHRYYSDNQEDALIMHTPEILEPPYRDSYQQLKRDLYQKLENE